MSTTRQEVPIWKQCYHSFKYPITTYYHLDDLQETEESNSSEFAQRPYANSTAVNISITNSSTPKRSFKETDLSHHASQISHSVGDDDEPYVGDDISHIPRIPPTPATYTIPDLASKSTSMQANMEVTKIDEAEKNFYGMISLKENDVCYTSGTIEWVGKKRSFPLNSGFKIIKENEDISAKKARLNRIGVDPLEKQKDCDCADVLPTVSAIVAHLNALHEAVDLVDLRLSNLEDVVKH